MTAFRRSIVISPRAAVRLEAAARWLDALPPEGQTIVVAARHSAADDLVRAVAGRRALFGINRFTPTRLVGALCADALFREGLAPVSGLSVEAVAARAVHKLAAGGGLGYFAPVADRPGFPGALARTLSELRMAGVGAQELQALDEIGAPLAAMLRQFEAELAEARLVDRAAMLKIATAAAMNGSDEATRYGAMPLLLLDVAVASALERDFFAALAVRSPSVLATVPHGDGVSAAMLEAAFGVAPEAALRVDAAAAPSLARLQDYLFSEETPPERSLDDSVEVVSAPGEMQECVEVARRILAEAARGIPFDQIAVALHAPARYVPYLEEALGRAAIPTSFARGASRPEPGGRALLALLACAAERLSARRWAEYLSLAQVPDPRRGNERPFVAPDLETAGATAPELTTSDNASASPVEIEDDDPVPVVEGTLRAPWRWERLLVDASVIGSRERWQRRLDGLREELAMKRRELVEDDARAKAFDRRLIDLEHLRAVAMPQIDALAALPQRAAWGEWLVHLRALTHLAVRDSAPVLAALAELEPMAPVGPVSLDEVRQVLAERLGRLEAPPPRRRYGAVLVAPTQDLRGLSFEVVIVPGLTERIFPKKLIEDPILLDAARKRLGHGLELQADRAGAERLALRLAAGAARRRVLFSYPRIDLDQGRPRVPSFYALEVLRAAEGRLPGFDELARRATSEQAARLGWPAPRQAADAIDEAEFDLAVLERLVDADPETTIGAAHYLLGANEHLARALRARARRWLRRWTPADGLVDPAPEARAALARHQLSARSYSPTALQHYAVCPYRFLLYAIHRIQPREEAEAIEVIDPLTRGALLHEVQFELLTRLRAAGRLPVAREALDGILSEMDRTLEEVAHNWHERLAPAIERVWNDAIDAIRADLREWLRRAADDPERWTPERCELAFGLEGREQADPASRAEPVALALGPTSGPRIALSLRGSIDLVERAHDGRLRVTDHKSGKADAPADVVIGGGRFLQPVLYALAAEKLLKEPVESGRLYYCTSRGGYEERVVALDAAAREAAGEFAAVVNGAIADGFLPAAPAAGACEWCDYRMVCGPYEELRTALKPAARLASLEKLRSQR
ncbi:MAG TPA: PD-(D/E)XK nuclease family protein [Candidatus Binataceae bacterium]|nr:PD-(D/E)XK nuclease family protein [Candidatus Binataceae bacterium]